MDQLVFLVKGSAAKPYEVTFIKDGVSLTAVCTCPAGEHGNVCKHRMSILDGKSAGVVSDNVDQIPTVTTWLSGTDVETALTELRDTEKRAGAAKETVAAAKKKLARAMNS